MEQYQPPNRVDRTPSERTPSERTADDRTSVGRTSDDRMATGGMAGVESALASPVPLGLSFLAFATAVIGCYYASFIIPYGGVYARSAVGAVLLASGIVLLMTGMRAFQSAHAHSMTATIFTAYGGFLLAIGLVFLPLFSAFPLTSGTIDVGIGGYGLALGLFFLCWAIFAAILFVGTLRRSSALMATTALLCLAFLLLAIGQFVPSITLLRIGGWLAIIGALVSWAAAVASILASERGAGLNIPAATDRFAVAE